MKIAATFFALFWAAARGEDCSCEDVTIDISDQSRKLSFVGYVPTVSRYVSFKDFFDEFLTFCSFSLFSWLLDS